MVTALAPTGCRTRHLLEYAASWAAELGPLTYCGGLTTALDGVGRISIRLQHLAASEGRQDALLCPRDGGGFVIVVDPDLSPKDRQAGRDLLAALDWRIAHELGHTYFYDRGAPPQRWSSWSRDEEDAADFFAAALLRELGVRG